MSSGGKTATAISILALIVSFGSLGVTRHYSEKMERRATEQDAISKASRVQLTEAPTYVYKRYEKRARGKALWVIMNTTNTTITEVWVEGKNRQWVRIQGIQGCTMYVLPGDFIPQRAHFKDTLGQWQLDSSGVPKKNGKPIPAGKDTGDATAEQVENCS